MRPRLYLGFLDGRPSARGKCRALALLGPAMAAGALASGGAVVFAPTAGALPGGVSCYGDYCSGKGPEQTGCARSAVTLDSVDIGVGELDLRYSKVCKTEWAWLYVFPTQTMGPGQIWAVQPSTGYTQSAPAGGFASSSPRSPTYWTEMIYSPSRCVSANFNYYPGWSWNVQSTKCI